MSNIFKSNNNNYKNEWNNKPNNANRENKKVFLFNNESFPDLVSPKNQENVNIEKNNPLFTKMIHEQLEKEKEKEEEKEKEKKEEKRWIVLKKGVPYQKQEEPKKEEKVEPRKVFELLTKNYEIWKKNYIDLWGHDDYEHHYRFPNHDYRYYETTSEYNSDLDLEDY